MLRVKEAGGRPAADVRGQPAARSRPPRPGRPQPDRAIPRRPTCSRSWCRIPTPRRKRLAIEGLGRISDASRLAAFKKDYQRESNDELRLAYSFALTRLGDRAFVDTIVLSLPSRTLGTRCRDYLLEMGRHVLPDLYPYLGDPDAEVRAALCDIMAALGDPEAVARLTPLINDPSPNVADRANRAVERLAGAAAARTTRSAR